MLVSVPDMVQLLVPVSHLVQDLVPVPHLVQDLVPVHHLARVNMESVQRKVRAPVGVSFGLQGLFVIQKLRQGFLGYHQHLFLHKDPLCCCPVRPRWLPRDQRLDFSKHKVSPWIKALRVSQKFFSLFVINLQLYCRREN